MAQYFSIHPENPQPRLIRQAAEIVRRGGVIVYPTDSCYALGCAVEAKDAQDRIRRLRGVSAGHPFSFACRSLAEVSRYSKLDNRLFRLLKGITPGSYTFVLPATRDVPRRVLDTKRSAIGFRVPAHPVAQALLAELNAPLVTSTLLLPGEEEPLNDPVDIRDRLEHQVDLIMDAHSCGYEMTTVIDLTGPEPVLLRAGKGELAPFGLETV